MTEHVGAKETPAGALELFGPATRRWFGESFAAPTRVQAEGWPRIAAGEHTLMLAPTGSGKTLAAFLFCLDRLAHGRPRDGETAGAARGVRVLYISPLKALAYDIERNLRAPLVGMQRTAEALGLPLAPVRVDVRTGDTPQRDRRRQAREPGEILITTPESLFLILGSEARRTLATVETVIVDEVHALAPNKRGVHLALSLERLTHLVEQSERAGARPAREPQRIGLSATQRPLEVVARFVGGDRPVSIVDASEPPRLDLEVVVPLQDMRSPAQGDPETPGDPETAAPGGPRSPQERTSVWPAIYPRLLEQIRAHRSTILFCNSRRLAERLAQQLNDLAGEELVRAHHGSVARAQRQEVEEALKAGELAAIAATSSLELGIDMGAVDLVLQVESPGSVARGLQRVGRAGHAVGEVSRGKLFPKHRGDLLETAVVTRRMLDGEVEPIRVPKNTLDVLAQQIVAISTTEPWEVDALEALVRRSESFAQLGREALIEVLEMLAGRYPADELAELRPRIVWDRVTDRIRARPGAKMISLANAGTIPDRGAFGVHLGPAGPRIGELDEEMVYESRAGETFLLGASSWRIEQITRDQVIVSPAPGEPGKMPFWRGAGPGRPIELGRAVGAFVRELQTLEPDEARQRLCAEHRLDPLAAANLLAYVAEQREATGALPTDRTIVIERFPDELGDWRVCILSPFGSRVHAPWALALEASLSRTAGFEVQTLWSDDGIVLRFADGDELPGAAQLVPEPEDVEALLLEQLRHSALFASHFRENAARSLLLPRRRFGKRSPLWAQRLKAQELMAVATRFASFPVVLETYRECLQDVFDLPALVELLQRIRRREVRVEEVETAAPSPFSRSLVFDYVAVYLYEGDAPLAERKALALTLDRNLLRDLLGHEALRDLLDAAVIAEVEQELQQTVPDRRARSADEVHDLLRRLGDLSPAELAERCVGEDSAPEVLEAWVEALCEEHRALRVRIAGEARLIAAEDAGRYREALGVALPTGVPAAFLEAPTEPLETLVLRWARRHGPFGGRRLAARYGLPRGPLDAVLRLLTGRGELLEGEFHPEGAGREHCHPVVLRIVRRRTLARLRDEVAAVDGAAFARFLGRWHEIARSEVNPAAGNIAGVRRGPAAPARIRSPRAGISALREAVAQLEGLPLPFSELESRILPARVADYRPAMLDELGATGELVWVGRGALSAVDGRVVLLRRERASLLLAGVELAAAGADVDGAEVDDRVDSALGLALLEHLERRGASFFFALQQTCEGARLDDVVAALWDLVWAGLVTNDTFHPLRDLRARTAKKSAARRGRRRGGAATFGGGRWSLTRELLGPARIESTVDADAAPTTEQVLARAQMLLLRYGVVSRETVRGEPLAGAFAGLASVMREMEQVGKLRRGYFVEGLRGMQFSDPGAVERLREGREPVDGDAAEIAVLAAVDPANPYGTLLPWPATRTGDAAARPSRRAGATVVLCGGAAAAYLSASRRGLLCFAGVDDEALERALDLGLERAARQQRRRSIRIEQVDGKPVGTSPLQPLLGRAGFARGYREMVRELGRSSARQRGW